MPGPPVETSRGEIRGCKGGPAGGGKPPSSARARLGPDGRRLRPRVESRARPLTVTTRLTAYAMDTLGVRQLAVDCKLFTSCVDAYGRIRVDGRLRSFKTVETGPAGLADSIPVRLR